MNHIYKSIFNKALGVFTAVPEFASAHGKGSERTVVGRVAKGTAGFAASALAISVGLALTSTNAVAAGAPGIYVNNSNDPACMAFVDDINVAPAQIIYGGSKRVILPDGFTPGTALSPDTAFNLAGRNPCVAVGGTAAENHDTQTNRTLFYNDKQLTLGGRLDVNSGIIGVGDRGTNGAGATNSIRMGTGTTLDEANKKENAISIGVNTKATEVWATAIGANAVASGGSASQALGYDAVASGKSAIAQGYHSHANGQSAVAIGDNAKASSIATVSIGYMANGQIVDVDKDNTPSTTKATYGTAVGHYAGADYTGTDNESITALGNHAGRYGEGGRINTAVGNHAGMYVKGSQNVAMGNYAGSGDATNKLEGSNTVSIGSFAKASGENGVAMGYVSAASGIGSIALGKSAEATDQRAIAMGENARAGNEASMALGYNSSAKGSKQVSIGLGAGALKKATDAGAELATFVGHYAGADNAAATGNAQGVAVGVNAGRYGVAGIRNVAVGSNTGQTVNGDDNTSIGYNSGRSVEGAGNFSGGLNSGVFVKGSNNVALGSNAGNGTAAQALEVNNTTSIGNNAKALTDDSISIGRDSKAGKVDKFDGKKSIAIGYSSGAMGSNAIALGSNAATNNGHDSIAMGTYAKTNGEKTISIGAYNTAEGAQSIVIAGNYDASTGSNRSTTTAAAKRAIVVGPESHATAEDAVAIGNKNTVASARTYAIGNNINVAANTDDSLVFGTRAHTDFSRSIAMGVNASTLGQTGVAIGDNAVTNGVNQISIGHKAGDVTETDNKKTRRPNVGNFGVMIGHYAGAEYTADEVTPVNHQHGTVAVGTQAGRAGKDSWSNIALGNQAGRAVHGNDNIAIGVNSGSGKMTDKVESDGKDVSTVDEYLNVKHSISVGTMSAGKNNYSIAIGTQATAGNGQKEADGSTKNGYSVAIGTSANASALNSVALGAAASASHEYSVALGRDSKTSDVHTGVYTLNTSYAAAGQPNAANGTVSVGSAGKERQIQNVAAGVISATSTDAINGSQLYATNNYLSNLAGDVKTKLGGNAALGNDGHLTMTNIGGTGKDNVNDAIAAANTKVAAGDNITVTPTTNTDGSKTYTVATKKDLVVDSVKAGDTTVNKDGLTIAGGPSVKKDGINAGDKKITGVADGNVAAGSKEAVNGGQLAEVKAKADSAVQNVVSANPTALTATKAGDTVTLTPNVIAGDLVNPATGAVNTPAAGDAGKLVTAGTVANALANTHFVVDTAKTDGELDAASKHDQKIKSGNKVTLQAGKNLKAKQTNAADGATVEFSLKDSISLTQVTAGTGDNQVVLGNNGVQVGGNTYINKDGLNANNKPISNVADGVKPKDAVNKGQLDAVAQEAAKHTTVKAGKNVEVSEGTNAAGGKEYTVKTADNLNVTSVKAGDSTLNTDGLTITGGPSVKKDGINAGNKKITGVADGNVAAGSKEAVNGGQLAEVKAKADSAVQDVVSSNPTALTANKVGNTVTLTPNFIAGDLVNADGTVKDPAAADEGKLVSAKTVADALKANHFVVDTKANGGTVDAASEENAKVGSGNKVTFEAGKNLVAQQTNTANGGATVNYKLSDKLENLVSVKSAEIEAGIGPNKVVLNNNGVKVGDSTLNDKGLTINNGPSVTDAGIDAGNKKITGVADGNVAAGSTDAVNGGQLAEVKAKADSAVQDVKSGDENALTAVKDPNTNIVTVTPKLSGDLVDTNGNITAPTTPADKGKLVTAGTVAEALANTHFVVDTKATDGELDAASQADQKIKASNKVTLQAGKNLKAKQTNGANGAEVEFSLKDSISLKEVKVGEGSANEVVLNNNGVNVAGNTYINKDGLNANDKKITNVAPGAVTAASKDAVNGSQLYNVANNVKDLIGPDAAIDPATGKVTVADPAKGIGETGKGNIGDAIKHVNDAAKAAAETAAKHTTVVEGKNVKVTKGKNAAGGDEYTVATKDDLDVTSVTAGNTTVNTNGLTITGGPSVTRGGIDAGNRVISGVKAGDVSATSQEAVNGSQLHATNTKLDGVKAKADTAVQDVKSGDENALTAVKDPNTNIVTVTPKLSGDLVDANGNITAPTTPADKGKLVTAGTVADALANTHFVVDTKATDGELDAASQADQKIKAGNKVTLQAGKNLKAKQTNGANGAQVEFSLKDSISLKEVTAGEGANQVVLGNDGVKVGGNTYINNDGLNANGNKITNVADGVDPKDAVNKGQLDAVKGVADSAVKSVDVANGEQNLVVDNSDPKNPKLSLKKDLTVDSVKAGDSTLNNDGLTIAGGPSVKKDGINAGDKTITNVAPGAVTPTSKDAVNGGQLYNVANNVKDLIGPDATIDPATGKVTVADPAKGIGETGKGNIGDAIKHVNDAAKAAADTAKKHTTVEQGDNIVVEESLNADGGKHYKVSTARDLNVDSVKAGDTTVNNDGVTVAGGPSVTKAGINAGGNTITNVADGVNPNDAVNKGQLDAVKGVADSAVKSVDVANGEQNLVVDNSDPKNPKLSLKKDLTVDSVKAGDSTLNTDGLTIAGGPSVKKDGIDAADKKITNVAAGDVAENSKDAVNGGQLHNVAKGVADVLGGDAAVDGNGKVTMTNIGETGKGNVNDAIKHVNDLAKNAADTAKKHTTVEQGDNIVVEESTNADGGKHYKVSTAKNLNVDSVKAGDTTVNNDGVTIAGGPSVTKGGINAGGNTITNVADGVNPDDAVNKGQLDKVDTKVSNVAQNVVNVLGGDATVNGNGDITMSNIGDTGKGNVNDAIKAVNDLAKKAAAEKTSVKAKDGRSNVTVTEGTNAAGGHEYTVDVERAVTEAGSDQVTVTSKHDADSNTTTYTVDVSDKTKASLAKADSAVQGLTSKDGNLNFTKGANGNVEVSFNDNLNVKNVTTDRVQVANGPSMSKDGINAAGKAISNVANGNVAKDSKDAVNGGQLHETAQSVADVIGGGATVKDGKVVAGQNGIGNTGQNTVHGAIAAINQNTANNFNQIRGDLRKMDRDLRGGIAGALATAGLPQAFRPGKSMVAAAASTYRGQSGLAIGVSRISDNGKVILKVTGNTNSRGDFGGTIGAGYQW